MTPKERWLAAIEMKAVDRLPFWPKIGGSYPRAQSGPFCEMDPNAVIEWTGSDPHTHVGPPTRDVRKNTSFETVKRNGVTQRIYRTRHGSLEQTERFDEESQSMHPMTFPVKTAADIPLMIEWYEDGQVEFDADALEKSKASAAETGQRALIGTGIGESPLMLWVEHLAGIENAHYLLADCTAEVEALFDVIHRSLARRAEIICEHSPADVFYMTENTSTTLISPEQYRRYCLRHLGEYARIANAHCRPMVLHMCGHLKALLPDLATLPVSAFEAFTSPTLGNTTLLDGRTACPSTCLIGGTNAMLWLRPANEIIAKIEQDLNALPHHRGIVVTSAGVMPPRCKPETIKAVCEWVKTYPVRN